ncbi:hypothetical protein M432DRAFT_611637, partial [Thermoascus aurantiacus ATCC 26904]
MAGSGKLEDSRAQQPRQKVHYPFWFGGSASCFAAAVTHPLDLVKVYYKIISCGGNDDALRPLVLTKSSL